MLIWDSCSYVNTAFLDGAEDRKAAACTSVHQNQKRSVSLQRQRDVPLLPYEYPIKPIADPHGAGCHVTLCWEASTRAHGGGAREISNMIAEECLPLLRLRWWNYSLNNYSL